MNRLQRIIITTALAAIAAVMPIAAFAVQSTDVERAGQLAARLDARLGQAVQFKQIKAGPKGGDVYSLESRGGKVVIGGNNALAMAVGLNRYLKKYCLTTVSWYADVAVELPATLPTQVETERATARVPQRFFLNYCTLGYTMPFWKWRDWERMIDWMALNGVNMPLAITGQEAVWRNVWRKLGMTDSEVKSYFTGPVYLPWHRMANIDAWCGPLPDEWLDSQAQLQKQIVARERELNMRPVLPAFAGHVPSRLAQLYPKADIKPLSLWQGFGNECQTSFLYSEDPLFGRIQRMFLEEQTRLYGTDHIYGTDPFNEMTPPRLEPEYLKQVSSHIYQSIASVDPKAQWLQMAWLFYYARKTWTPERAEALVTGAPKGRMIMLDYFAERKELWRDHKSFYGQPYIWCYLGNFGGNTSVQGNVHEAGRRIEAVIDSGGSNLAGIGSTLEGLDVQQMPFEYVFGKAWSTPEGNVATQVADSHAGYASAAARQAWQLLLDSVYVDPASTWSNVVLNYFPEVGREDRKLSAVVKKHAAPLTRAWLQLLQQDSVTRDAATIDLITVGRDVLAVMFRDAKQRFDAAMTRADLAAMTSEATVMTELLRDVDALNAYHPQCTLAQWIAQARNYGSTPELKDYYEMNARRLITTWGGTLNDYANRSWSGLAGEYYAHRWQLYIDEGLNSVREHRAYNDKARREATYAYQRDWSAGKTAIAATAAKPQGSVLEFSRLLAAKWQSRLHR